MFLLKNSSIWPSLWRYVSPKRIELLTTTWAHLKSRRSSLKWAQVEVCSSIRLEMTVCQSSRFYWKTVAFNPRFVGLYLLNELSYWPQLELILKSRRSSLRWAQVEVCNSIRLEMTACQSLCFFWKMVVFTPHFLGFFLLNKMSYRPHLALILKNKHSRL